MDSKHVAAASAFVCFYNCHTQHSEDRMSQNVGFLDRINTGTDVMLIDESEIQGCF